MKTPSPSRVAIAALFLVFGQSATADPLPGGSLPPRAIDKYVDPLPIPAAMPPAGKTVQGGKEVAYYEVAVRQFEQQILPGGFPKTSVWSYGSTKDARTFQFPALTFEARYGEPLRVKWINGLATERGDFLPHLLPIDPTLHWANPPGGDAGRDSRPTFSRTPDRYEGPVPISVHLHGGHVPDWADGFPEAWFLPDAKNIPKGFAREGSHYREFKMAAEAALDCPTDPTGCWTPGSAVFQYDNLQDAATLWYHDHTLGMTRTNVYAGPAGFYLLRGGEADLAEGVLPGPAPKPGDGEGQRYYEIPLVIQDRSFNRDGSLFYPDTREFFDGFAGPYVPEKLGAGGARVRSDVSPMWNPEFFGNTIVVNGKTWPYLEVEARRYRFRILNASDSRFLILTTAGNKVAVPFWQIGADGGFLRRPVKLTALLVAPAERADVIVDFTGVKPGTKITLFNLGPDEPFGGGEPGLDFDPSDPDTTGQVLQFRVVKKTGKDASTPPQALALPVRSTLPHHPDATRKVSLNELDSATVCLAFDGTPVSCLDSRAAEPFGPLEAQLGTVDFDANGMPMGMPMMWADEITENVRLNDTEVWEIYNFTMDAHPIHIHEIQFEVIDREPFMDEDGNPVAGGKRGPESWETGFKDTVIAYPGEITRVKATFDRAGLFVWHCHILSHEDNEMMRPYRIGDGAGTVTHH